MPHILYSAESEWGFFSHLMICFSDLGFVDVPITFRWVSKTSRQKAVSSAVGSAVSRPLHHQSGNPCSLAHSVGVMVGDLEKSSFSNIEQQSLEFVKYTLDPWVCRWEQSMVRSLLTEEEKKQYFIKFNVDGLLRGDYQSRMNGYSIGRQNGWMSANDIRELENLDRIPEELGGDLYLINGNMTKLSDAGLFGKTQPASGEEESNENEEVLEVEESDGDNSDGENSVSKRHHRRR